VNIPLCRKYSVCCDGCALAIVRSHETGDVVECVCGRRYSPAESLPEARQRQSGVVDVRAAVPTPSAPAERPKRPPPRLVYVAPDGDAPTEPPTALERAGAAARALHSDDPELVRVRRLLTDLRPDCGDPCEPPPDESEEPASSPVTIRDPSANWGGIPRGVAIFERSEVTVATGPALVDVLRQLAALAPDEAAVLRWLRRNASLASGLRGLYVDAGVAFASAEQSEAWEDLGARREGAPAHGRRVVLRAATAWEGR